MILKLFKNIEVIGTLPNTSKEAKNMLILKTDQNTTKRENFRAVSLMNIDEKS